ncbi:DEAD/DEAH box helicase [Aneurinibacillus thermoaerophilus]|uniref:DEAD/DEAH box helicase n=1 Tax=Aneurinibacillus thermoaerophilus TaxID=143495 RepID=UPI002E1DDBCE|nr:DEAD/DEAH box helicase [Aneurinibacillus thermoaerophilus]MED0675830.1 helicase-related protein [Aneurinibacillus thermoaerophilus]
MNNMQPEKWNYNKVRLFLEKETIDLQEGFSILSWLSKMHTREINQTNCRDLILRFLDKKEKLPSQLLPVLNSLVESTGYFPYVNLEDENTSIKTLLHCEFYRSENIPNVIMHQKQAEIYNQLSHNSIILSAPTSFGKSLLIEEIVASNKYNNIVIILPTLALIDEIRQKLSKYSDKYKLIFTTKQTFNKRNILILTAEKFIELEDLPQIDFFIIDEFYKLSDEEDERVDVLNHTFYKLLKSTNKFYLLGPNIASIPKEFEEKFHCKFLNTDYSTVTCDEIFIKKDKNNDLNQLYELLITLEEPTMIYCKSPAKAEEYSILFTKKLKDISNPTDHHQDAIDWIEKNIHKEWSLNDCLKYGLSFHHGPMPRHIGRYVVSEFNKGTIKYLFCTSTLIEGINTSAKNVVIFDNMKGGRKLTYFDYRNICGRAGRMNRYFIGKVFNFHDSPKKSSVHVDFPWFTQNSASDEILIQMDKKDLKPFAQSKIDGYNNQNLISTDIIKKNNGISVSGQISLAKEIESNIDDYHRILCWTGLPGYEQLVFTCTLMWNHLIKKGKDGIFSPKQLALYVNKYISVKSSIPLFIKYILENDRYANTVDKAVQKALNLIRKWFEFRFPKYLLAFDLIQKEIFKKHNKTSGDYKYYASLIETGMCEPNLSMLKEFGIPLPLLKKLEGHLNNLDKEDLDSIISQIKNLNLDALNLEKFEIQLLKESIMN